MSDLQEVVRRDQSVSSLPLAPESSQIVGLSPIVTQAVRPLGTSSCSHVPVGYFDQEGVSKLRPTLTHLSESARGPETVLSSSETLSVPATGPFDFEKTLRNIMRMYVVASAPIIGY